MRIEKNMTIYAGAEPEHTGMGKAEESGKAKQERKTIFAGSFQGAQTIQERIEQRKQQAQKEALKIVRDAWAGDQAIDQGLDESREHIRQLQEENLQAQRELNSIEEERVRLKETYGVTDSTPVEDMPEDYRSRLMELNDYEAHNKKILGQNRHDIMVENAVIRGTKLERLKKHPMVDAQNRADEVLEAASDEIVGMVMDEAREHLDEEQEKREEQAEKIQEKKEELEELQEKRDERKEELEELLENVPVDEMLDLDRTKQNIQQEVQDIVNKMKLVAEDIKGSMVDTNV